MINIKKRVLKGLYRPFYEAASKNVPIVLAQTFYPKTPAFNVKEDLEKHAVKDALG